MNAKQNYDVYNIIFPMLSVVIFILMGLSIYKDAIKLKFSTRLSTIVMSISNQYI